MTEEKKVTKQEIREWIQVSTGDWFHLDDIRKGLHISEEAYGNLRKAVHDLCGEKICEPKGGRTGQYRRINAELEHIDWLSANPRDTLNIKMPNGRDSTGFSFDGDVQIYPRDLFVVAGVSGKGKTAFVLNLMVNNMDEYHCRLMGNEYEARKFANRMLHFDWVTLINDTTKESKFELIRKYDNFHDIIEPDSVNIIDWMKVDDKFWEVRRHLEDIQKKLERGIAIVALQKTEGKSLGEGSGFGEHLASVYLIIDTDLLTVRKMNNTKSGRQYAGKRYHFSLEDFGSKFMDIYEVKKCSVCHGFEHKMGKKCIACDGTGYSRVEPKQEFSEELPF